MIEPWLDNAILIAGGLVPFVISLLKRWFTLTKAQVQLITLVVGFIVASVFELIEHGFTFETYLAKIVKVIGASQIVYLTVFKTLELDKKIEE